MRKRFYVSERITNISRLEKLLEEERLYISILTTELKKDTPSIEKLNGVMGRLEVVNKKATSFEFCLERRKTCS